MGRVTWRLTVIFISCLLVLALLPQIHAFEQGLQARQVLGGPSTGGVGTTATPTTNPPTTSAVTTPTDTPTSTPTPTPTTTPASPTTTPTTTTPTQTTPPPTTSAASTTAAATPATTTPTETTPTTTAPTQTATNTGSHEVTTVVTDTPTGASTAAPAASSSAGPGPGAGSGGGSSSLGTGSIIGLSVAGGVAVIGIVAFLIWKLTRKRFSDFDDNEAIKWPELNTHGGGDSHPLPVHNTGRAGFGDTESLRDTSRAPSVTGYADSMTNSTTELYPGLGADPYAVPPLPHLNPNQPYLDDPQAQAFYDPYRGPVPNTFDGGEIDATHPSGWSGEAIPMTQMSPGGGRARSPGPQMAYDDPGRAMSPQQMASRRSPAPSAAFAYGEPALPSFSGGPVMEGRARSPGPAVGFGGPPVAGRRSPGPQDAFDTYGAR